MKLHNAQEVWGSYIGFSILMAKILHFSVISEVQPFSKS